LRETARNPGRYTVGEFETVADRVILDLTNLPGVPSIFEESRRDVRPQLIFLNSFVKEFAKPVALDGSEHVEYVPTQIITEYFRNAFRTGTRLAGIRYPSAQHQGGSSVVLFVDGENFIDHPASKQPLSDSKKIWLHLLGTKGNQRSVSLVRPFTGGNSTTADLVGPASSDD
jgi:hypothetical protein